ncbi:HAMP domain-containing protein [Devosia sp.]|uniref:HAMP domain-containing protein n=1 Tax=Devosia sp. TaxID=1871048 RepID=UPI003A8FC5B6
MAIQNAMDALDQSNGHARIVYSNTTSDLLLSSAGSWALERGLTNTALAAPEPASPDVTGRLTALRASGDAAMTEALERIAAQPMNDLSGSAITLFTERFETARKLRLETEEALDVPVAQRPPMLAARWVEAMTQLIHSSQDVRQLADFQSDDPLARIALIDAVKSSMWTMSEFSGLERAHIGGAIASGAPLDAGKLRLLSGLRGRLEQAWHEVKLFAQTTGIDTEIADATARVDAVFFGSFEALRKRIYAAGIGGAPYPIDAQTWIDESTRAIDTILEMQKVAGAVMETETTRASEVARGNLALSAAGVLLGLALAVGAVWLVIVRVVRPLQRITAAMTDIAAFRLDAEIPYVGRKDEVGRMAGAATAFRDNARVLDRREL